MKIKIKTTQKNYIETVRFCYTYAKQNNVEALDLINLKWLYYDAICKFQRWCDLTEYKQNHKIKTVTIDANYFNTLNKISLQLNEVIKYDTNETVFFHHLILNGYSEQYNNQINKFLILN